MIDFQKYITEGVYDPNIFKAFFLAGGPGSGKSWVSERTLSGIGLKVINSDNAFALALNKEKMSLNMATQDAKEIARRDENRANASLEVALKRNQMRARRIPDAIVINNHKQVQQNIGKLQRLFGSSNFIIVDNNKPAEDVNPSVYKAIRRMINRKPTSYQAISWIKRELQKKKR